jgi:Predicted hydrolases of the HAD superfamily
MFRVVASDLDGTLLTPEHCLSPYTKQVLQALRKKDIHFVLQQGDIILMWLKCEKTWRLMLL